MRLDRKTLFDGLRAALKPQGGWQLLQIAVINAIAVEWERRRLTDLRWLAYIMATAWHEARFISQREVGRGKGRAYGKPDKRTGQIYYGRGLVQLTWYANYLKFEKTLNLPLTTDPDLALQVPVSVAILFEGMTTGITAKDAFTKYQLEDFFNAQTDDPVGARRIINGTDKAKLIAGYHALILDVLLAAERPDAARAGDVVQPTPQPVPQPAQPATPSQAGKGAAGTAGAVVATGGALAASGFGARWILAGMVIAMVAGIIIFIIKQRNNPNG